MRVTDLRIPRTRAEAEHGLLVCARSAADAAGDLFERTEHYFDGPEDYAMWRRRCSAALERWQRAAQEFRYHIARFDADESGATAPVPADLSNELARLRGELNRAQASNAARNRQHREALWGQMLHAERVILGRCPAEAYLALAAGAVPADYRRAWNAERAEAGVPTAREPEECEAVATAAAVEHAA